MTFVNDKVYTNEQEHTYDLEHILMGTDGSLTCDAGQTHKATVLILAHVLHKAAESMGAYFAMRGIDGLRDDLADHETFSGITVRAFFSFVHTPIALMAWSFPISPWGRV